MRAEALHRKDGVRERRHVCDAFARDRQSTHIDAGSAVTVDWVDETGAFCGGAIMPGFGLMAKALHDYTALLPLIEPPQDIPAVPGVATIPAIQAGVFWAVVSGVWGLVTAYARHYDATPEVILTGGDGPLIGVTCPGPARIVPLLTLDGVRLAAQAPAAFRA